MIANIRFTIAKQRDSNLLLARCGPAKGAGLVPCIGCISNAVLLSVEGGSLGPHAWRVPASTCPASAWPLADAQSICMCPSHEPHQNGQFQRLLF
jgi:hypothetical protein